MSSFDEVFIPAEEAVEVPQVEGIVLERINKEDMQPLFTNDHEHIFAVDPDDQTDEYIAEMCTVKACPLGRLVPR